MKKFETPVMNVVKIEIADVLTTSIGGSGQTGSEGGAGQED